VVVDSFVGGDDIFRIKRDEFFNVGTRRIGLQQSRVHVTEYLTNANSDVPVSDSAQKPLLIKNEIFGFSRSYIGSVLVAGREFRIFPRI